MRLKPGLTLGIFAFLCMLLPGSLWADTIYTYTGNAYTSCTGSYGGSCNGTSPALNLTFTVGAGTSLSNLSIITDFTPFVTSFIVGDGKNVAIFNTDSFVTPSFAISTDASGNIEFWSITINRIFGGTVGFKSTTNHFSNQSVDESGVFDLNRNTSGGGSNLTASGTWTKTSTDVPVSTPEPASWMLLSTGLICLVAAARRRPFQL